MGLSSANNRQHGGDHYQKTDYQHWDFICDNGTPYLIGCATKYVARWRKKGGKLDLQKAMHYLEKAMERNIFPQSYTGVEQFASQLGDWEHKVVVMIMRGDYSEAIGEIDYIVENYDDYITANGLTDAAP